MRYSASQLRRRTVDIVKNVNVSSAV